MTKALEEKHRLIAEILNIDPGDFDHIAEVASARLVDGAAEPGDEAAGAAADAKAERDAKEVLLAALAQGKKRIMDATLATTN